MKLVVVVIHILGMISSSVNIIVSDAPLCHVAVLGWCIASFAWSMSYYKQRRVYEGK
jgi:hypothetical protein